MNILIVEDDRNLLSLLNFIFKKTFPNSTIFLSEGDDDSLNKRILKDKIDLVILDLMLPNHSGTDLLIMLKEDARTMHVPVIVVTAKTLTKDVIKHFDYGVAEYIKKPFDSRELIARVKAVIKRNHIMV